MSTVTPASRALVSLEPASAAGDHVVGLLRDRAGDLGAEPLGQRLGLGACHLLQRAGEHHRLVGDRRRRGRCAHERLDSHLRQQVVERLDVVGLAEEVDQRIDHRLADALDVVEILIGLAVLAALGGGQRGRAGTPPACPSALARSRAVVSPMWRMPSA